MARYLVHIGEDFPNVCWVHEQAGGDWSEPVSGTLQQLAALAGDSPVEVLAPAEEVLLTEVTIASRQRRRLLQALPYSVEDQLAGDIDDYHIALGQSLGNDRYLVAAVSRATMDRWQSGFVEAGLLPHSLMPDSLAVPLDPGSATVVVSGDRALIRCAFGSGYAVRLAEASAFLALEQDLSRLMVYDPEQRWTPPADLEVRQVDISTSVLALLATGLGRSPPLNLLQGPYHRQGERAERAARVWRWVAVVAMLAFSLEVTGRWLDYRGMHKELALLQQESRQILTTGFPNIKRVVDARSQMDSELSALRQASGIRKDGFLFLLRAIGPTLLSAPGMEVRSASYRGGNLIIELHADSLASIETARQRIITASPVQVELEFATTLENGADARLRITGDG